MSKFAFIPPCVPKLATQPPSGPGWLHEVKFDGWRVQIHNDPRGVLLYSRNGKDLTPRFSALAAQIRHVMDGTACVIDGEIVASDAKGLPNFRELMSASGRGAGLTVWGFDLLALNAADLRGLSLADRKDKLCAIIGGTGPVLQFSDGFDDGENLLAECDRLGLEGIVCKRRADPYRSGPSTGWRKVKCAAWREVNRDRWEMFKR